MRSKGLMLLMMMMMGAAHGRERSVRSKTATFWRGDEFGGRRRKTLYGSDDRLEESEVSDSGVLAVGAATAALVRESDLSFNQASSTWYWRHSSWTLDASRSANGGPLCSGQRYADQPSMASCSGTLIGPDLWATAGHCISGDNARGACRPGVLTGYKVVFGYTDSSNNVFPQADVYDATEVVHCVVDESHCYGSEGVTVDWAVLRLDRQVVGRTPATVQQSVAQVGDSLYIVGHPSGLPRKYTSRDGAEVLQVRAGPRDSRDHANVHTVVTNLDAFSGNSGSGVFNGDTNEMVGILVEGGQDWEVTSAGCSVAHTCYMDPLRLHQQGCPGQEVVSSTVLLPFLMDQAGCTSDADCNAGTCAGGVCECEPEYHGPDCSFKCERAYCNNRGACVGYDQCECDDGGLWPPLCSVDRRDCQDHGDCASGAYCAEVYSGTKLALCWECTDCEGRTCEDWEDSIDGSCARCDGTAPPRVPVDRGTIECGDAVTGNTALALSQVGEESGENLFVFSLDSPQFVHFDSCDSSFDTFLRVMSEDLRIEYADCDDCGPCGHQSVLDVVLEPGTYALLVEGYGSAGGAYEIQMACTDATDVPRLAETVGSCACLPTWSVTFAPCDDADTTYHGCHAPPCDGDTGDIEGQSWCLIETSSGCNPVGDNWDYCVPGNWLGVSSVGSSADELAQNSCGWAYDNECDEPMYCEFGTDTADCSSGAPMAGSGNMQWSSPADSSAGPPVVRPPPPPPPAAGPTEQQPCTTYPEFTAYSQEVTATCCDDASAPCVAGLPTACSEACADVLLPMQTSCYDFLGNIGMQETIDTAAAFCAAPLEPCTSYPEFMAYSEEVTAACCDDASAPCVAGLPTTCSHACADVLLPMQRACKDFLGNIGMQSTINAAVATCGSGH